MNNPDLVFDLGNDSAPLNEFHRKHYNSIDIYVLKFMGIPIYVGASAQIGQRTRRFTYKKLSINKEDSHNRIMRFLIDRWTDTADHADRLLNQDNLPHPHPFSPARADIILIDDGYNG